MTVFRVCWPLGFTRVKVTPAPYTGAPASVTIARIETVSRRVRLEDETVRATANSDGARTVQFAVALEVYAPFAALTVIGYIPAAVSGGTDAVTVTVAVCPGASVSSGEENAPVHPED